MAGDHAVAQFSLPLQKALSQISGEIDQRFDVLLAVPDDSRAELYRAMRHAAIGGGKRLRPLLLAATARIFGVDRDHAARAALAVECIHVYSLVHDDLPAMDDDDLRRGKPTVHKAFDQATAILVGDALQTLAFEIMTDPATHPDPFVRAEMALELARAAGPAGMVGGQMMDIEAEKTDLDLATITRLQALKTGALISCAVECGMILGHVPVEGRTRLRGYARDLGLAFQIADDILDATGDEAVVGKRLGKDMGAGKETFLTLLGVGRAREQARMLVDQAIAHLHGYGSEADLLRDIARFVLDRDR
ncbi:MAG TPA: farnesyl diphosphate synthase [Sphingomonas sp.]|nr:farnesyl diphosphate synthase [Sphingomonas sp.]